MTTLRWQIAPELALLRRQAELMLETRPQASVQPMPWKPAAALRDLGDRYELRLQLPGIDATQLDIQASRNGITVAGDRPAPANKLIHSEFRSGSFQRAIRLPEAILPQQVRAHYDQGLLTLTLPKLTAAPDYRVRLAVNGVAEVAMTETAGPVETAAVEAGAVGNEIGDNLLADNLLGDNAIANPDPAIDFQDVWADAAA